jgi:hypothetical protein
MSLLKVEKLGNSDGGRAHGGNRSALVALICNPSYWGG